MIIKGFTTFSKISKRKFHGIGVYVRNHLRGNILRVPDEDDELEVVHIIIKNTTPVCNVFGCYLDVESRSDQDKISRVWTNSVGKLPQPWKGARGILLQVERLSFGTRLLEQWLEGESVTLLNDRTINTRYDTVTGKSSLLDLGITSTIIRKAVTKFVVDSENNLTP